MNYRKTVRTRVSDLLPRKVKDQYAETVELEHILTDEEVSTFIRMSKNRVRCLFKDGLWPEAMDDLIVQGAVAQVLATLALREKPREFAVEVSSGVFMEVPKVSDLLQRQSESETKDYWEKVWVLKEQLEFDQEHTEDSAEETK